MAAWHVHGPVSEATRGPAWLAEPRACAARKPPFTRALPRLASLSASYASSSSALAQQPSAVQPGTGAAPASSTACSHERIKARALKPDHVAIIMDGNRRWARARGVPSPQGHKAGADALFRTVEHCIKLSVSSLTIFAFSQENWSRGEIEVRVLWAVIESSLAAHLPVAAAQGVRLSFFGDVDAVPDSLKVLLKRAEALTQHNTRLHLAVALNYSGKKDIVQATRMIAADVARGCLDVQDVTEEYFAKCLLSRQGSPGPPELLIRTSGEQRVSNFVLWDLAYTELYFSSKLWPDFGPDDLEDAVTWFGTRQRRFGGD